MEHIIKDFQETMSRMSGMAVIFPRDFISQLKIVSFKKGTFLLKSGTRCRTIWYIYSGFGRYRIIKENGDVYTANFFQESDFVTEQLSMALNEPAEADIEALEDIEAIEISAEVLRLFNQTVPHADKLMNEILKKYESSCYARVGNFALKDKDKVYRALLQDFPGIEKRVSQKIIASFLNITPVHLSRLKISI